MPQNKTSDRARISFDLGDPNVQAQMQARDTYVAPGRVTYGKPVGQGEGLMALGKALGVGLQKFQAYDAQLTDKMIKDQTAKAQADFQLNRTGFKQAVKNGEIPVGANPHYVRNYQRAELSSLASEFGSQLDVSMTTDKIWEKTGTNDISDTFTDYKNKKLQEFLTKNNIQGNFDPLDVANNFAPIIQKEEQRLLGKATELTNKFNEAEGIRVASRSMRATIDKVAVGDFTDLGLGLEPGKVYGNTEEFKRREAITNGTMQPTEGEVKTALISRFQSMLDDPEEGLIANGMSAHVANETLATSILTIARDTGDLDWLDVLGGIKTNNGAHLANSLKISENIQKTKSYIVQKEQTSIKFKEWYENSDRRKKMFDMKYESMINNATFDKNRLFFDKEKLKKLSKEKRADILIGAWELAILSDPDALKRKGPGSWNDPWLQKELADIDPDLAKKVISSTLQIRKDMNSHQALKYYTSPTDQTQNYMDIYKQQINPDGGSQFSAIEKAYRHNHITQAHYEKLRQFELDRNVLNHPLYKSPLYTNLETQVEGHFSNLDPKGEYSIPGLGKVSMGGLKIKMHMVSYEFLKARAKGEEGGMMAVNAGDVIKDTQLWLQGILTSSPLPGQTVKPGAIPGNGDSAITRESMLGAIAASSKPEATEVINKINPGFSPEVIKQMEESKTLIKDNLEVLKTIEHPEMFADLYQKGQKILENFKPIPGDPRATDKALDKLYDEIRGLGKEGQERAKARGELEDVLQLYQDDPIIEDIVKGFTTATKQPNANWIELNNRAKGLEAVKNKRLKAKAEQEELKKMNKKRNTKKKEDELKRQAKQKEIAKNTASNLKAEKNLKEIEELMRRTSKKK